MRGLGTGQCRPVNISKILIETGGKRMKSIITLGRFQQEISGMKGLELIRDEPLEPISIHMPVEHVHVILSASPYIALRSGSVHICLSHIQTIRRSTKRGRKLYRIKCGDYTASDTAVPVEYCLWYEE